jgi:hypothetical protein
VYDLPDTEVVKSTLATNVGKELAESPFIAVLRLDVEMAVNLPAIDIVENVMAVDEGFEYVDLLELRLSVASPQKWPAALLHCESLAGRRTSQRRM